jgi:thiamine pyrophosphokinase
MKESKQYRLFLNSEYNRTDLLFYSRRIKEAVTVAVDGGVRFFLMKKIYPDIIIGDFDSSPRLSARFLSKVEVIKFPAAKDKTDSQLALELALFRQAEEIEIFAGLARSEIDHTLGNIFLLELVNKFNRDFKKQVKARLIDPRTELAMLENNFGEFDGLKGDILSIIPLSANPMIDFTGLKFPPPARSLRIGDSLSLRNQFIGKRVSLKVVGKAIIVVIHKK